MDTRALDDSIRLTLFVHGLAAQAYGEAALAATDRADITVMEDAYKTSVMCTLITATLLRCVHDLGIQPNT